MNNIYEQLKQTFPEVRGKHYSSDLEYLKSALNSSIPDQYTIFVLQFSSVLSNIKLEIDSQEFRLLSIKEIVDEVSDKSCKTDDIDMAYLEFGVMNQRTEFPIAISDDFDIVYLLLDSGNLMLDTGATELEWPNFHEFLKHIKF